MLIFYSKNIRPLTSQLSRIANIRPSLTPRNVIQYKPSINRFFNKRSLQTLKCSLPLCSGALFAGTYVLCFKSKSAKCDSQVSDETDALNDTPQDINKIYEYINRVYDANESFNWCKLWDLLKPESFYLIIAITSSLIVAFLNIHIPISLGSIMNVLSRFASEGNSIWTNEFFSDIKSPAFRVLELYIFQSIFTFMYISSLSIVAEKFASRLRQQLFNSIIKLDVSFFDNHKSGEIISRITTDVQDFKSSFKMCISQGLRSVTQIIGCAISMFVISPKMTILMGTLLPGMVIIGTLVGSVLREKSREAQAQVAIASGIANEAISNIRTVKAFAMEESQSRAYNKEILYSEELNSNLGFGIGIFQGLVNLALNSVVLSTLLFGGYLLSREEMTPGNLMSFLVSTQTIQRSMAQLSLLFGQYVRGMAAGSRVFAYLVLEPSIRLNEGFSINAKDLIGDVIFRNVTFAYSTRPEQIILSNFNLRLMPGKVTAICGLSGAGKSTIASLLERFYDISDGSITIDGHDLKTLDLSWLRRDVIGFINQEPILFGTTIRENIRFGKLDATDEEVYRAAQIANADSFIRDFPDGYDTMVGERGVAVSGGQKQRIAIARAVIKNPTILVLDEATSALDSESEALVQEALDRVMKGRTVLVIAHRLSTIQNADLIAVIAKGKIIELGTHNSLKKLKGRYWQLIRQQSDNPTDNTSDINE